MTAPAKPLPPHGTYRHYTVGGCRCDFCRAASAAYAANRDRQIAYGRWNPFADAEPVRAHLRMLTNVGIGPAQILRLTDVPARTLSRLLYDTPPTKRINTEAAQALLAVRPSADAVGKKSLVDPLGSARRLQALAAIGFPISHMYRLIGVTDRTVRRVMAGRRVYAVTAATIAEGYARLSTQDPIDCGVTAGAARYARRHAKRRGWPTPTQWDGQIDDPAADPHSWVREEQRTSAADLVADAEWLHVEHGLDWDAVAAQLGVRKDTLHTYRSRVRERAAAPAALDTP